MSRHWKHILPLFFTLLLTVQTFAQTFRGTLSGSILDTQGAVIANAELQLQNPATDQTLRARSNGAGEFSFPELPVGVYQLTVSSPGFQTSKTQNINIEVSKVQNLKIQLSIGTESQVVEVTANAVQTDTTSSSLVAVIDSKSVQEIPLNGRNFTQMVTLSAGVNINKSVNGTRTNGINYQIDGADNNDPWSNNVASNQGGVAGIAGGLIPIEAIDQFSMQAAGEADMGRNAGANSNLVLRSGTNSIHGDVFYFDRNEYFAWLAPTTTPGTRVPEIRNHQGGFTLGGPIWRDKTFLFLAGEIQIANANNSVGDTVLSNAWITAATQYLQKYNLTPNAVSMNLYNTLFPADSKGGPAQSSNYLSAGRNTYNSYNGLIKLDHHFSDRETISIHYLGTTGTQSADVGSHYADYFQTAPMHIHNVSIIQNSTFSSTLVNQLTAAGSSFLQTFNDRNQSFNTAGTGLNLGLGGILAAGATKITVSGFDYTGATAPLGRQDVTGHITDTLHWTIGRHNLKIGGEYRHANVNVGYYTNGRGAFTFDGSRGPWASNAATATANCAALGFSSTNTNGATCNALKNVADFLNGQPSNSSGAVILRNNPQRVYLVNGLDFWLSDSFQLLPRLSVNYGVRWSYPGVVSDDRNSLYNFDPTVAGGFSPIPLYNRTLTGFAPRVGFSYALDGNNKTVVRGAFGIFYDQPTVGQFVYNNIGNTGATGIYSNPAGSTPVFQPSVSNVTFASGASIFPSTLSPTTTVGAFSIDKNYRTPYFQNFNLNIEHQASRNTLVTVGYVGSLGRRLSLVRDINQPINGVRPYLATFPTLLAINQVQSAATSNFNSLQVSIRQAPWHGLSATAYYTYARSMDFASSVTTPMNSYNLNADYGPSTFDVRNTFTGFANYVVPQLAHFAPRLTKGYEVKALYLFSGGNPINLLAGSNISGTSENKDRASRVSTVPIYSDRIITTSGATQTYRYLTAGSFASPVASGTTCFCYGNASRNAIYGPGFGDIDLSFFKRTPITERVSTELRAEIFNIWNQNNFANPSGTVTSSSFGLLTQTRNGSSAPGLGQGEPRNIQFAFKVSF